MKCPVCKREIGTQLVCPFCGNAAYPEGASWNAAPEQNPYQRTVQVNPIRQQSNGLSNFILSRLTALETKSKMILLLLAGVIAIQTLILVVLILK